MQARAHIEERIEEAKIRHLELKNQLETLKQKLELKQKQKANYEV